MEQVLQYVRADSNLLAALKENYSSKHDPTPQDLAEEYVAFENRPDIASAFSRSFHEIMGAILAEKNVHDPVPMRSHALPELKVQDETNITPVNFFFTTLPPREREAYQALASLGWTVTQVVDSITHLRKVFRAIGGMWTPGIELSNEQSASFNADLCVEKIRIGWTLFQKVLAKTSEQRCASQEMLTIERNNITMRFDRDGPIDHDDVASEIFCQGLKLASKQVCLVADKRVSRLVRMLLTKFDLIVSDGIRDNIIQFKPTGLITGPRGKVLGRILDVVQPKLHHANLACPGAYGVVDSMYVWLCDNWDQIGHLYDAALECNRQEIAKSIALETAKLVPPETHSAIVTAFKLHDLPDHRRRNAPGVEYMNSANAGGYDGLFETKRPLVFDAIVKRAIAAARNMGDASPSIILKSKSPADVFGMVDALSRKKMKVSNLATKKNTVKDVDYRNLADKMIIDLEVTTGGCGFEKFDDYAALKPEELPLVAIFQVFAKRLPSQAKDYQELMAKNHFPSVQLFKPPGYHNSSLIVVAYKYSPDMAAKTNPVQGFVEVTTKKNHSEDAPLVRLYVPPNRISVVTDSPALFRGKMSRYLKVFSAVAQYYETVVHGWYSRGLVPAPCDLVLPEALDVATWKVSAVEPPETLYYNVPSKSGRPDGTEKIEQIDDVGIDLFDN